MSLHGKRKARMAKNFRNTYQLNRARSVTEADNRENRNLMTAVERAGLDQVESQWESIDQETDQLFHFDVAGIYQDHRFLFDLSLDYRDDNAPAERTKEVLEKKREWATANDHTHGTIYRHGDMNDFRLAIKQIVATWLKENNLLLGSGWL